MTESLQIKIDLARHRIDVEASVKRAIEQSLASQVSDMFKHGKDSWNSPRGIGYDIISQKVDEFVLSEKFSETVERLIEKHFEKNAEEAVKALLNSRSRKYLFDAVPHQ
jgi:peptidyl-tRNA hydrolase